MRLIKMLGLGALAALATMAFVGVTGASADSLCLEEGHHATECPLAKQFTPGNVLGKTGTEKAKLLQNGTTEEECNSQVLGLGTTYTNNGTHKDFKILVDTGALVFTNCTGLCEEATSTTPAWLLVEALTLDAFVLPDPTAHPRALLKKCFLGVECEYEFTSANQLMSISGNSITASSVPLTLAKGSGCPNNNMSFDAKWFVTKDETGGAALFVAALP